MTHSRKFRQFRSLRASKPPRLLDSGSIYSPLEEPGLPTEGLGGAGPCRGSSWTPQKEEAQQDIAWTTGNWGRRAASLRAPQVRRDEALGEAAHSLGPGDGQLLIGAAPSLAGSRVKKCKQQVRRSLRQGWETFMTNLNSLTLSSPPKKTQTAAAGLPQVGAGAP
ncbi:hypothetical protein lerEdw1_013134 [Lerista edwardsae]|nr:hypothetical protein lerEdw1_013134 [Lerista edwardsae]